MTTPAAGLADLTDAQLADEADAAVAWVDALIEEMARRNRRAADPDENGEV